MSCVADMYHDLLSPVCPVGAVQEGSWVAVFGGGSPASRGVCAWGAAAPEVPLRPALGSQTEPQHSLSLAESMEEWWVIEDHFSWVSACYKFLSQSPDHSLQLKKPLEEQEEHCCGKMYSFLLQMKFKALTASLGLEFPMYIRNFLKISLHRFLFFFLSKCRAAFPIFFYLHIFLLWWEQRSLHLVQLQQLVMKMCRNCQ